MLQFFGGGGSGYPGVSSDNNNGLIIQGHVKSLAGIVNISGLLNGSIVDIPTGVQTNIGPYGSFYHAGFPFPLLPVDTIPDMGFSVPLHTQYRYDFSIPITAGSAGGDILVEAVQNGSALESWTFTLTADEKTVLDGFQVDTFNTTDTIFFALTQSSGTTWNTTFQPLIELSLF